MKSQPSMRSLRRIVTRKELCERLGGICLSTLDNYIKRGILARSVQFGPNRVGWLDSDIEAYFDRLLSERDERERIEGQVNSIASRDRDMREPEAA